MTSGHGSLHFAPQILSSDDFALWTSACLEIDERKQTQAVLVDGGHVLSACLRQHISPPALPLPLSLDRSLFCFVFSCPSHNSVFSLPLLFLSWIWLSPCFLWAAVLAPSVLPRMCASVGCLLRWPRDRMQRQEPKTQQQTEWRDKTPCSNA